MLEFNGCRAIKRVLLLAPVNTLANWQAEFKKWINDQKIPEIKNFYFNETCGVKRSHLVELWYQKGGVLCSSFKSFARNVKEGSPLIKYMQVPGPDRKYKSF